MSDTTNRYLDRPDGARIAYRSAAGSEGAGVLWLGGFASDMTGTKAAYLADELVARDVAYTRFDYFGHGASSGAFEDGTIGRWIEDAAAVLDAVTVGPQVLVGSSMGGWVALHLALAHPERVAGMVLIAPAADFTEDLMWAAMSEAEREVLMREGVWRRPSEYGEAYPISRGLIEDGRKRMLLGEEIAIDCPVRILQGMLDADVPWGRALTHVEKIRSPDVVLTLIKSGDHRLSDAASLERLLDAVLELVGE